jgi:hypothetical protein
MSERLWPFNDLARFLRYEDPEVRCWAADRLVRHYPEESADILAPYLFDDHDLTPETVATYLGRHGRSDHFPLLSRGARTLRGMPAARALEALVRLRAPEAIDLVRDAFERKDFDEECWSCVAEALADSDQPPARRELREFLEKRADWCGLPAILRAALKISEPGQLGPLLRAWIRSLQWRGAGSDDTGEPFRVLMDHLEIDDCGWCFRTNLKGRVDFIKTLMAVESAYDCDVRGVLGEAACRRIAAVLEEGAYATITSTLAAAVRERAGAVQRPGDELAGRIVEATDYLAGDEARAAVEGLGPHLRDWVIGFLLAAVVKMARYQNCALRVRESEGDLDQLLPLLEHETSMMLESLPDAIGRAVAAQAPDPPAHAAARRRVEERCLSILASRGPFFPQAMALETLGELRALGAINEIIDFLSEENAYLYEAAEHALGKMELAMVEPVRARIEAGTVNEEAGHSLLILLCELGAPSGFKVVLDHLDWFAEAAGAGDAARWTSLFGARELIAPLRRILPRDVPAVGQALLLLGAIHNTRVPEEAAIRRAIDEYWKQAEEGEGSGSPGSADGSDRYLM